MDRKPHLVHEFAGGYFDPPSRGARRRKPADDVEQVRVIS
jgi:hypothetical protein